MRLLTTTHQCTDTRYRNNGPSISPSIRFLLGHLVRSCLDDVKGAIQVDILYPAPEVMWEVEECVEWADARVGYEHVYT